MTSLHVAVLGAGSWGTALALHTAQKFNTHLWSYNKAQVEEIQITRKNQLYLPDVIFPDTLKITHSLSEAIEQADILVIAVPSVAFKALLFQIKTLYPERPLSIINATKGLDHDTNDVLSTVINEILDSPTQAVLSGPSFAKEVAEHLPTAITIAAKSQKDAEFFSQFFHHGTLRTYINLDPIGVQLAGTYKNVIAIAAGISEGLKLGANARAALITRGLAEMSRLGSILGGQLETFLGLAGVGDIVLTATDKQSRNYRFGIYLGEGASQQEAFTKIGQVVEGANTVSNIYQLGKKYQLDLPIANEIYNILHNKSTPECSLNNLLNRTAKNEA